MATTSRSISHSNRRLSRRTDAFQHHRHASHGNGQANPCQPSKRPHTKHPPWRMPSTSRLTVTSAPRTRSTGMLHIRTRSTQLHPDWLDVDQPSATNGDDEVMAQFASLAIDSRCRHCGKTFPSNNKLMAHVYADHLKQPRPTKKTVTTTGMPDKKVRFEESVDANMAIANPAVDDPMHLSNIVAKSEGHWHGRRSRARRPGGRCSTS